MNMDFISAIEQEATRITDTYSTHTAAFGIGLRLRQIVNEAKSEVFNRPYHVNVRLLTQEQVQSMSKKIVENWKNIKEARDAIATKTTNLDFWQAYQAMKRGEWVGNDEIFKGASFSQIVDECGCLSFQSHSGSVTVVIHPRHFDSTAWHIVPKGPRYKVGDRFDLSGWQKQFATIIAAEVLVGTAGTYVVALRKEDGTLIHFQVVTDDWLDKYTKLPS